MRYGRSALIIGFIAFLAFSFSCDELPIAGNAAADHARLVGGPAGAIPHRAEHHHINDRCQYAVPITQTGTYRFSNRGANTDGPAHASCTVFGQSQIANDLWYCFTAPCDGGVIFETCGLTSVDTKIAVYDGCACPSGDDTLIACNEDACGLQSSILFDVVAGQQYLLRLGNFAGPSGRPGEGSFSIECVDLPSNETCDTATGPLAIPSVTPGSTELAAFETAPPCTAALTAPNVWYSVVGTGTTVTASLCNAATTFDTRLAVYCGSCDGLTCVAGNDQFCGDQSRVTWCAAPGVTYFIAVHGFDDAVGPFELELSENGIPCTPAVACP